jgi:hypothetical protein
VSHRGAVDYREALLGVIVPFGALVYAYMYTERKRVGTTSEAPTHPEADVV